ncbi:hypothetical protein PUR71_22240 [Streptomyces sp. SP17BM10]|uniref:hypothetical protein n=1 Tax=Streptomyces sp. SP17BM10 TaxID=3002530 RepID=UPI002E772089|nr:hypothetical protein [Streptomyces sp. SP17BM10]MEE1785602.1 hypothetical protein [Streptomyces sp. SP17BM10]
MSDDPTRTKTANTLKIPERWVTGFAMTGLTLITVFLACELPRHHPPDLGQLGLSGIVSLIMGTLANPQGDGQGWYWKVLLAVTFVGAIVSAVLTGFSGRPAAAPAMSMFAAAFFGLLVDGEKLSVGIPST